MTCACLPCFGSKEEESHDEDELAAAPPTNAPQTSPPQVHANMQAPSSAASNKSYGCTTEDGDTTAKTFTFRELANATKNFRQECLLCEGGFGRVFKGTLQSSGQIVAVRQLDRSGTQGNKEFQVEVLMLSLLHHPNLVGLIGYCADGDQRLLVYEHIQTGSLDNSLFDLSPASRPLSWAARMKIASGIAQGLEYLHEKANPPIIYRDLKSSNILLDEANNPKLSEYGLAKLVQSGNKMHVSPSVMAAYGYCAPEYERQGELTPKSDVYSFGVILLELITGRRALDTNKPAEEQNLVAWAQPIFRDPKMFSDMADPLLRKEFSVTSLNQAVGVASMCLQEEPSVRPLITDVVDALGFLATAPPETPVPARLVSILSSRVETPSLHGANNNSSMAHRSDSDDDDDASDKNAEEQDQSEGGSSSSEDEKRGTSRRKLKESSKWGSSSRRKGSTRSSDMSSMNSRDYSSGFSLRCDSNLPEHDIPGSSSDEEPWTDTSHDRNASKNSRRKASLHKKSLNSNSRRSSSASSEGEILYPRQDDDEMERTSMRSSDESDFQYSRTSSMASSEHDR